MQTIKISFVQTSGLNKTEIGKFEIPENCEIPTKVIGNGIKEILQIILKFGFLTNVKVLITLNSKLITLPFTKDALRLNFNILLALPNLYFNSFDSALKPDTLLKNTLLQKIGQSFGYKVESISLLGYQTVIINKLKFITSVKQKIVLDAEKCSLNNTERLFIHSVKSEMKEFRKDVKQLLLPIQTVKQLPTDTVKEKNEATKKKRKTTKKPVPVTV